jgi:hypothetical protein
MMSDRWRTSTARIDDMRGLGNDQAASAAGWTISGLPMLGATVAEWIFAI